MQQAGERIQVAPTTINDEKYLTEAEVARMVGRARSTLAKDRFFRRGIPYFKIGRSVRYLWRDVKEFMDVHRIETCTRQQ